ncbi:hypothetical protein M0R04_13225 [Candidatus Dojkabacteria bacterium]|jgi:hypothetical protein|nr:hypothetical protein [Candidatus Dojkabacteria bacterium]
MQKIFKCQTCGLDKTLEGHKTDKVTGKVSTFMSCPNWKDEDHKKARDDWKRSHGAPQGTYNASPSPQTNLSNNPDVYDLLTTIVAQNNKIMDILNKEMPSEENFE